MAFFPMERIPVDAELRMKPEAHDVAHVRHSDGFRSDATDSDVTGSGRRDAMAGPA
jgi:hypothetical protein